MYRTRAAERLRVAALALVAGAALLLGFAQTCQQARAIAPPQVFTVVQAPGVPSNVSPGDAVTFDIAFTSNAGTPVLAGLVIEGDLAANLAITSFTGGTSGSACTALGSHNQQFSCDFGALGANASITPFTVNAVVRNVTNDSVTDLAASAFFAKDGPADGGANPATDDLPALTVLNEDIAVTQTPSAASVNGGQNVNFVVNLTNNGDGGSGIYTIQAAFTGGTVYNVSCPAGGIGSGNGSALAVCPDNPSLSAAGGTSTMTVTVTAGAGATSLTSTVTLVPGTPDSTGTPSGIRFSATPATITVNPTVTATATSTPTSTATNTPTPTGTATPTPTGTATTPTPAPSSQLVVSPGDGTMAPRSRLTFSVTDGSLTPTGVKLVIRRVSDGNYWNAEATSWQSERVENPITEGPGGTWTLAVTGAARRQFVDTSVELEARATVSGGTHYSQTKPVVHVR